MPRNRAEDNRGVLDGAGERADVVEGPTQGNDAAAADPAEGGLEADDAAKSGGDANGAARVRTESGRAVTGGDGVSRFARPGSPGNSRHIT